LIENNNEEAVEVLHLIIQKRTRGLQREDPEVEVTEALKNTIMSLIRKEEALEKSPKEPEDVIEELIRRHLNEQASLEEITLKNEDKDCPRPAHSEDDKISRYMMLARIEAGRSLSDDEKAVIIKAVRATTDSRKGDERAPPWRRERHKPEKATSPFDTKEEEGADERLQTLKKTLTTKITKPESSEASSSDEYTYEDDSEGEFLPAKEGTPITVTKIFSLFTK
jgi:hypothetical protein